MEDSLYNSLSFSSAHSFVFSMPMFLLAFYCTVGSVPATPVNGFGFAIVTLEAKIYIIYIYILSFGLCTVCPFSISSQATGPRPPKFSQAHSKFAVEFSEITF
jgi:hypothetical protein